MNLQPRRPPLTPAVGGVLLGADDYLPLEDHLATAWDLIDSLQSELQLVTNRFITEATRSRRVMHAARHVLATSPPVLTSKRQLIGQAWSTRANSISGLYRFARRFAWVMLRSRRAAIEAQQQWLARSLKAQRRIVRGRPDVPKAPLNLLESVTKCLELADFDQAYVLLRAHMSKMPDWESDQQVIKLLRDIQTQRGAISSALAATRCLPYYRDRGGLQMRRLEGQIRELSGWFPKIPGPPIELEPASANTILHLVKESRPYLSNGFTSRGHNNILAERSAGLQPIVLTELGFPRSHGIEGAPLVCQVEGVEHRILDLGPSLQQNNLAPDLWLEAFAGAAFEVIKEVRPSVIHVRSGRRGYETALVGVALKRKTGLPLIYEMSSFLSSTWTANSERAETGELFAKRLLAEQRCALEADAVITLGHAMVETIRQAGVPAERIHIIPNGVDLSRFRPRPRCVELAESLDIGSLPTFGYVSNLDHYRESQETLVEAAAELMRSGLDFRCILVGDGPRRKSVYDLAFELGVAEKVVFTGSVNYLEVADYYSLIDVFVVPRIDERAARLVTPLKPFEAMAIKRPLIVSDLPALNEIVDPPKRGLVFRPGDSVDLAKLVAKLWQDPILAGQLAEAGYKWVRGSRQWMMNGKRYEDVYAAVRAERSGSRRKGQ